MAQPESSGTSSGIKGGGIAGERSRTDTTGNGSEQRGGTIAGRVRERAAATLETQKDRATDGLGNVVRAVRSTEEQLRSQHHESVADYVAQVANQIDGFSQRLREKRVTELIDDAQRFARRHPAAFAGSAFALGVVTARFLKSSGDGAGGDSDEYENRYRYGTEYGRGTSGSESTYGSAAYGSGASSGAFTPGSGTSFGGGATGTPGSRSTSASGIGSTAATGHTTPAVAPQTGSQSGSAGTASPGTGASSPGSTGGTRSRRSGSETERS